MAIHLGKLLLASVLALGVQPALAQDAPASMTISTASPGGVYAIYGEGVAQVISDVVGIPTSTRQTQGPAQNLILLKGKQTQLGMTTSGPAFEAMNGKLELAPGEEYKDLRALFPMYPTPFQMVSLQSTGIDSLEKLDGQRVGAGPRAGTGGTYWPRWLDAMGVHADLQFGGIGDQADQLGDGRLDAIVTAGGVPHPSLSELESTQDVIIFGMSDEELGAILERNPYAVEFAIPTGTYKTPAEDIKTAAMWNFVVADASMPDDLAYRITKAVLENNERMVSTHATARDTLAKNILQDASIPLHPGALRYYEEIGIEIPDDIRPN